MNHLKSHAPACLLAAMLGIAGCTQFTGPLTWGSKDVAIRSAAAGNDTTIDMAQDMSVYAAHDAQTIHVMLIKGPAESPDRAMHITMRWRPKAGQTPLDPSATNATVQLYLFEGDGVGVYGGGGHLWPRSTAGARRWSATLRNASLRPMHLSDQFNDMLGICVAEGALTAQRDEHATLELVTRIERMVEDRLGYPLMLGSAGSE